MDNNGIQFNGFVGNMSQMMNPNSLAAYCEQQMRNALASGKISQGQFNSMAQTANQMMGR